MKTKGFAIAFDVPCVPITEGPKAGRLTCGEIPRPRAITGFATKEEAETFLATVPFSPELEAARPFGVVFEVVGLG